MIIERISEYNIDPDLVAEYFHDIYQDFIAKNDNEDTSDFVYYMVESYGLDYILHELSIETDFSRDNFL